LRILVIFTFLLYNLTTGFNLTKTTEIIIQFSNKEFFTLIYKIF